MEGVYDILPPDTPLIGGTVAGFMNNYGVYARGVTALAISSTNMDVAIGIGKHTKIDPEGAAKQCAGMIKHGLRKSESKNKVLINIISGPTIPSMPLIGRTNVIKSKYFGWLATHLGIKLFSYFGNGMGKEEDIVDHFTSLFPNYYIIGGSSMDDYKQIFSYQFIGEEVHKNSLVALGLGIDDSVFLKSLVGIHSTDKIFKVTGSSYSGRLITSIDNKPAKDCILDLLGITEKQYGDISAFYYKTANYFPITFEENPDFTSGIAGFLGDTVALGYKIRGEHVRFLSLTGKESMDVIDTAFNNQQIGTFPFVFMSASAMVLNTLGAQAYSIKDNLNKYFKDTPYLMICTVNENSKTPGNPAVSRVYSFNALSINSSY